jgi:peroxiredoxin
LRPRAAWPLADDPSVLPAGLPVPVDDGAAAHLPGLRLPDGLLLASTGGQPVDLAERSARRRTVVFAYPRTGRPDDAPLVPEWDLILGARGCTPEACAFRDLAGVFEALGVDLFGLSTQDSTYQQEAADRLHLPYPLLSDAELRLTSALGLPTFEVAGRTLLKRLTLILSARRVEHVLYPVFPPDRAAEDTINVLRET